MMAQKNENKFPSISSSPSDILKVLFDVSVVEPTKLFDNLAYIGYRGVGSFVINTSDGIILIDTMWTYTDGRDIVEPGIKRLGWDPENIKYVLLTHEHIDHYGSAKYYEDIYGAKVFTTKTGWVNIWDPNSLVLKDPFGNPSDKCPLPRKFNELKDKQKLTLGDTTITVLATPGHSQGCVSFIIPVTDNGVPHMMAVWGGTVLPGSLEENETYLKSLNYFESVADTLGVDAEASIHPFFNHLLYKIDTLQTRKPGDSNPVVIGNAGVKKYFDQGLRKNVISKIAEFKKK